MKFIKKFLRLIFVICFPLIFGWYFHTIKWFISFYLSGVSKSSAIYVLLKINWYYVFICCEYTFISCILISGLISLIHVFIKDFWKLNLFNLKKSIILVWSLGVTFLLATAFNAFTFSIIASLLSVYVVINDVVKKRKVINQGCTNNKQQSDNKH